MTYTEIRAGLGFEWQIATGVKFALEGGYQPYRSFDFYRADVRFKEDGDGAPYGMISFHGAF